MLEKEFQFYLDNQTTLLEKFNGKFIVIIDNNVIGAYETKGEAYNTVKLTHAPGTFLIQHCSPGKNDYTQTFHSRVSFV